MKEMNNLEKAQDHYKELNRPNIYTDLIFTFSEGEQEFAALDVAPSQNKKEFIAYLLGAVSVLCPNRKLIKVSMCVYNSQKWTNQPEWYKTCNGKIWEDELKLS